MAGSSNKVEFYPDLGYILVVLGNTDSGNKAMVTHVRTFTAVACASRDLSTRRLPSPSVEESGLADARSTLRRFSRVTRSALASRPYNSPELPLTVGTRLGVYEVTARSAKAAWARCSGPATRSSIAMSP